MLIDDSRFLRPFESPWLRASVYLLVLLVQPLPYTGAIGESAESRPSRSEKHWAFIPPVPVSPPSLPDGFQAANPIDAFILAKLQTLGIKQVGPASKQEL